MKILVVEDNENKRQQLVSFLQNSWPKAELTVERSLQSGLRRIRNAQPDLVILDMTLPTYDQTPDESGEPTHIFGGREFLRQMDRFDIVVPVIVVTQFETFGKGATAQSLADLDKSLREEQGDRYVGAVYYHTAVQGWQAGLRELVEKYEKGRSGC